MTSKKDTTIGRKKVLDTKNSDNHESNDVQTAIQAADIFVKAAAVLIFTACIILTTLIIDQLIFPKQEFVMLDVTELMTKLSQSVGNNPDLLEGKVDQFTQNVDQIILEYASSDIVVLNAQFVLSGAEDITDIVFEAAK